MRPRYASFVVPGIFLIVLGIGNFVVATHRLSQYKQVLRELSQIKPSPALVHLSPLRRVQMAHDSAYRLVQRRKQVIARRDMYRLVKFGGKVFIALGVPFLLVGLTLRLRQKEHGAPVT